MGRDTICVAFSPKLNILSRGRKEAIQFKRLTKLTSLHELKVRGLAQLLPKVAQAGSFWGREDCLLSLQWHYLQVVQRVRLSFVVPGAGVGLSAMQLPLSRLYFRQQALT